MINQVKRLDETVCLLCDEVYEGECTVHTLIGLCTVDNKIVTLDDYGNCPNNRYHNLSWRKPKYETRQIDSNPVNRVNMRHIHLICDCRTYSFRAKEAFKKFISSIKARIRIAYKLAGALTGRASA